MFYSQGNLDRMALQLTLTKARPRQLYIPKMVLVMGWFSLVERRPASLDIYVFLVVKNKFSPYLLQHAIKIGTQHVQLSEWFEKLCLMGPKYGLTYKD